MQRTYGRWAQSVAALEIKPFAHMVVGVVPLFGYEPGLGAWLNPFSGVIRKINIQIVDFRTL